MMSLLDEMEPHTIAARVEPFVTTNPFMRAVPGRVELVVPDETQLSEAAGVYPSIVDMSLLPVDVHFVSCAPDGTKANKTKITKQNDPKAFMLKGCRNPLADGATGEQDFTAGLYNLCSVTD